MSVPLDRLYNFLHDLCNHNDLVIYQFFPHGSKKITDLKRLDRKVYLTKKNPELGQAKYVFVHDQEPLNFDLYSSIDIIDQVIEDEYVTRNLSQYLDEYNTTLVKEFLVRVLPELNLKLVSNLGQLWKIPVLLIHSEQRSQNLQKYKNADFIGVYWWCHAVIARDWFRYAEHDPALCNRAPQKDFLIYNRAWSGTREYRLKFAELLIHNQLTDHCVMGFNCEDNGDYRQHQFQNTRLQIQCQNLEEYFFYNDSPSTASADYNSIDYQSTQLEIVLETLFDDDRIQLTEKILRPIACGHPFMLLSTVGSLEYLQQYGFKTFANLIDETYDTIQDPLLRLQAVVAEMKRISNLPSDEKEKLYSELRTIADYNRKLFFSKEWHDKIINEYQQNYISARAELNQRHSLLTSH